HRQTGAFSFHQRSIRTPPWATLGRVRLTGNSLASDNSFLSSGFLPSPSPWPRRAFCFSIRNLSGGVTVRKPCLASLFCFLLFLALAGNAIASDASVKNLPPAVYQQLAKLTATDSVSTSRFSYSVAISSDGNTIVVGSFNNILPNNAAYVFVKPATGWAD